MDYIELTIRVTEADYVEILEAELAELPFDSFQSDAKGLHAYVPIDHFDQGAVDALITPYQEHITSVRTQTIPHQNWNAVWESNYDPVFIGDHIVIKAPFHTDVEEKANVLTIDPNMSFGTGHHPTTYLILEAMEGIPLEAKDLCDFGCGSGILSIYAAQRGASGFGVEIDPNAAEAARQNLALNNTTSFQILTGDLAILQASTLTFDVLLANINRNVIEESLSVFYEKCRPGGYLFCAGFLDTDAQALQQQLEDAGFLVIDQRSKDGWTMLLTQRTP